MYYSSFRDSIIVTILIFYANHGIPCGQNSEFQNFIQHNITIVKFIGLYNSKMDNAVGMS